MPNPCKETGSLTNIDITTSASPCPMAVGGSSTYRIRIDNNRSNSIYEVEIFVETYRQRLDFQGSTGSAAIPKDWLHLEPIISANSSFPQSSAMSAPLGSEGSDEVQTSVQLFDAGQRVSLRTFSGAKEALTNKIIFGIDVQ
jgi:hypothetical protein